MKGIIIILIGMMISTSSFAASIGLFPSRISDEEWRWVITCETIADGQKILQITSMGRAPYITTTSYIILNNDPSGYLSVFTMDKNILCTKMDREYYENSK